MLLTTEQKGNHARISGSHCGSEKNNLLFDKQQAGEDPLE